MTAKEALGKVKELLKQHFGVAEEAKDAKVFEEHELADGMKIQIGEPLEVGAEILVIAEDESQTPAPTGEYVLPDGKIVVVAEPGVVAEIKEAAPVEQKMAEEALAPDPKGGVDWSQEIKWIKESIANTAKQIATLEAAMQMFKEQTGQTFSAMQELMDVVSAESPVPPVTKPRQTTFSQQVPDREKARQRMIAAAEALRKKNEKK